MITGAPPTPEVPRPRSVLPLLVLVCTLGAGLRLAPILDLDFPLGDGGMFAVIIGDIRRASFLLPHYSSYNHLEIPLVYPPLAFYLAAGVSQLLGSAPLDVLRCLPALISTATVPALYLLAREVLRSYPAALVATFAYAVDGRAFDWLIAGGGLTRSLGLLCALLALERILRALRASDFRVTLVASVLSALTVLTHPQAPLFVAVGVMFLAPAAVRRDGVPIRDAVGRLATVGAGAAVILMPWLALLASRGQLDALASVGGRWSPTMDVPWLWLLPARLHGGVDVLGLIALFTLLVQFARGAWRLPLWTCALIVAGVGGGAFMLAVPVAMTLGDLARRLATTRLWNSRSRYALIGFGALVASLATVAVVTDYILSSSQPPYLSEDARAAIEWVGEHAEGGTGIAVISGRGWGGDLAGEWLPALTKSRSAATVQGSEWLGRARWIQRVDAYDRLKACDRLDAAELNAALSALADLVEVVLIVGPPNGEASCLALGERLATAPGYSLQYEAGAVLVFTRSPG